MPPAGANDIYTVSDGQKEYLIPAIPSVIEKTDIESGVMLINVIDGLFD